MFNSALRKDRRDMLSSRESIFEPTCVDFSDKRYNSVEPLPGAANTLPRKCKKIAKKFIKAFSAPIRRSNKNQEKKNKTDRDFEEATLKMKKSSGTFPENVENGDDCPKRLSSAKDDAWKKWQEISDSIDKNIIDNFTIRKKYMGNMNEGKLTKQKYYYIEGYGLVSEKSLMEFKDLQSLMIKRCEDPKSNFPRSKSLVNLNTEVVKDKLTPKKENNLIGTMKLKKELDTIVLKRPEPKPRTIFRSKSVTFVEVVGTKDTQNPQLCPNCHNCYEQVLDINRNYCYENDAEYFDKTKSLERTRMLKNQNKQPTLRNCDYRHRRNTISDLTQSKLYSNDNSLDNSVDDINERNQILNTSIKDYNDENIYQNAKDILIDQPKQETEGVDGNLDKTESIVYRNPFYRPSNIVRNGVKNYDIKMYESKLKMDFLVNTNGVANAPRSLQRSQSVRVSMDQAEAIMCENHYYDLLSQFKENTTDA